jgi:putative holliday junction resolvase
MARILAIDYGTKRVGIASTDELQLIANPLETVHSKDIIAFLKEYVSSENVECIVVGKPKRMSGEESEVTRFIEPFVKLLRKTFPQIIIDRYDERFTSKIALQAINKSGLKKKDRQDKGLVDKVSAALILQSYLEMKALNP